MSTLNIALTRIRSVRTCACMSAEWELAKKVISSLESRLGAAEDAMKFYGNNPESYPDGGEFAKKTLKIMLEKKI